jgi:hypothetical protein
MSLIPDTIWDLILPVSGAIWYHMSLVPDTTCICYLILSDSWYYMYLILSGTTCIWYLTLPVYDIWYDMYLIPETIWYRILKVSDTIWYYMYLIPDTIWYLILHVSDTIWYYILSRYYLISDTTCIRYYSCTSAGTRIWYYGYQGTWSRSARAWGLLLWDCLSGATAPISVYMAVYWCQLDPLSTSKPRPVLIR